MKILFDNVKNPGGELSTAKTTTVTEALGKDPRLQQRSKGYLAYFSKLDANTMTGTHGWSDALQKVQEEFGTAALAGLLVGYTSKCYLGGTYEVHILDITGTAIVSHYKLGEPMPPAFEKGRALAANGNYELIEIYTDKIIAIRPDGSATEL